MSSPRLSPKPNEVSCEGNTTDASELRETETDDSESVTISLEQLAGLLAAHNNGNKQGNKNNDSNGEGTSYVDSVDIDTEIEYDEPLSSDDESERISSPVKRNLAEFVNDRLIKEQSKEKLKTKFARASRPKNLNTFEVKINKALYDSLPTIGKKRDGNLKRIQNMTVKAINNITKVADMVIGKNKESKAENILISTSELQEAHANLVDGLGLMCQVSHKVNARRVSYSKKLLENLKMISAINKANS